MYLNKKAMTAARFPGMSKAERIAKFSTAKPTKCALCTDPATIKARSFPTRKAFVAHLDDKHPEVARPRSAEKQRAAMVA